MVFTITLNSLAILLGITFLLGVLTPFFIIFYVIGRGHREVDK